MKKSLSLILVLILVIMIGLLPQVTLTARAESNRMYMELTPEDYLTVSEDSVEKLACAPSMVVYGDGNFAVSYLADEINTVETEASTTIVCRLGLFNLLDPEQVTFFDIATAGQTIGGVIIGDKAPYEPNLLKLSDDTLLVLFNIRDTSGNYVYYGAEFDTTSQAVTSYQPLTLDGKSWTPANIAASYNAITEKDISTSGPAGSMVFTSKIVQYEGYYYGYCGGICAGFSGILVRSTDGINWESVIAPEATSDMNGVIECGFQFLNDTVYFCMRDISSGVYQCSYRFTTYEQLVKTEKLSNLTTSKPATFIQDGKMYVIVNKATGDDNTVGRRNTALIYHVEPETCKLSLVKQVFCADGCAYHAVEEFGGVNYWCFHTDARRINPYTQGRSNLAFLEIPPLVTTDGNGGILNFDDYADCYARGCITIAANTWQAGAVNMHYQIPLCDFAGCNTVTVTANSSQKAYIAFFTSRMTQEGAVAYAEGWMETLSVEPGATQILTIPSDAQYMYILATNAAGNCLIPSTVEFHPVHEHIYDVSVTAPVCAEQGYTIYTCTACGDSYRTPWLDKTAYGGKTIACVGDSITAAYGVTKDETDYVTLLADQLGMDYIRLGDSGTTLCTDGSRICNIRRLTEDYLQGADVVTIAMGINDFCNAARGYYELGDINSTDTSTIYGAARMWCERIVELRKTDSLSNTQFYFVTPVITSWNNSVTSARDWDQAKTNIHGYSLRDLCNAIIEVAALYDVAVIDLNLLSGMYYINAENNNTAVFGGDGVHPGATGHAMMASAMANVLLQNDLRNDHEHTFGSWITTTWPSCTAGEQQRVCTICSAAESCIAEPYSTHTYIPTITEPTCTEQGYTTYTCECGDRYVDDYTDAAGHSYVNGVCTACGMVHSNLTSYEGKVISILGDSISTFAGYIPTADGFNLEHLARYPQDNLLTDVNETWWMQVISTIGAKLGINDSWRGATVSGAKPVTTGSTGENAAMGNLQRIRNLGANGTPDVILFYGGTNDLAHVSKVGTFDAANTPAEVDLTATKWDNLADGYVHTLLRLKHFYPDTQIIAMLPTYTNGYYSDAKLSEGNAVLAAICEHYGVTYVDLRECGISTADLPDSIHPDATGMDYITVAVVEALLNEGEVEAGENVVHVVTHKLSNAESSMGYYKGMTHGKSFEARITGEDVKVTVTMGGADITDTVYSNSVIAIAEVTGDIVISAEGRAKPVYEDHLQELPGDICSGTNLWAALEHDEQYYTATGWGIHSSGTVYSVTIPVSAGDCIYATSFGAAGKNGSNISGIRVTWFDTNGVLKSMNADEVYAEFSANGYLTVPEDAAVVSVPMWKVSDDNELYILNREHSYTSAVTAPTCTEQGYTTYTCACGDSYVDTYVAATGHSFDEWIEVTAPACGSEGQDKSSCSVCDEVRYRDTRISGAPNKILVSNPVAEDHFDGKILMAIGDSLTAGTGVTAEESYHYLTAQALGMTNINSGTSGAVLCSGGHLPNKFETLMTAELLTKRNVDVVTIFLGVNDWDNGVVNGTYQGKLKYDESLTYYDLGEFGTDDTTTIYGATKMWCERILELQGTEGCEDIQFVFITPIVTSYNKSVTNQKAWDQNKENVFGNTLRQYCTAIMEVCAHYGVPVLDQNMYSGMYYHSESDNNVDYFGGDGIHPGVNGHVMMADALIEFLQEGYTYEERATENCGHSYETTVTAPNCTEGGYTTHRCSACYYSYVDSYVDALRHEYSAGTCIRCSHSVLGGDWMPPRTGRRGLPDGGHP